MLSSLLRKDVLCKLYPGDAEYRRAVAALDSPCPVAGCKKRKEFVDRDAKVDHGVIGGVGYGMLFRVDASSGGMDVVAMAARKRWGVDIGTMSLYVNLLILLASFVAVSLDQILLGTLLLYVESLTIDGVVRSFYRRTQVLIISPRTAELVPFITSDLDRTATLIPAKGAYKGSIVEMLLTVLPRRQVPSLKRHIASVDPGAFVIFSDVSEVVGEGFKSWLRA